jgi:hypothetical protein
MFSTFVMHLSQNFVIHSSTAFTISIQMYVMITVRQYVLHYICCRHSRPLLLGYVLEIGYDTITIIISDPYKIAVGKVPRKLTVYYR